MRYSILIWIFFTSVTNVLWGVDSASLRERALSHGMGAISKDFAQMLPLVDSEIDNPLTPEKVALGRLLFFDKNLSKSREISCATCHNRSKGGADGRATAIGHRGLANPYHLNSPTVYNVALAKYFFWDGRAKTLTAQAKGPMLAPFEMASTPELVVKRVKEQRVYVEAFKALDIPITFENIAKMVASYEKTLLTPAPFDAYLEGDDNAIDEKAKKGLKLFMDLGCKGCHTGVAIGGYSVQKFPLRDYNSWLNLMFGYRDGHRYTKAVHLNFKKYHDFPFVNVGGFKGRESSKYFRVPTLRNVTKTAPYFHNGAIKDLKEAIFLMGRHQVGVDLEKEQIESIEAFLKSLEADIYTYSY